MNAIGHSPRTLTGICAALTLGAGAAAQPPSVTYELSWKSIPSGSTFPLLFMESAQMVLTARVWPPVGTVISNPSIPGGGTGTVAGLGSIAFDVRGCQPNNGTWTLAGSGFAGTTGATWGVRSGWTTGGFAGTPQTNGDVLGCGAGQLPFPGTSANAINPVTEIWRGKWLPSSWNSGQVYRFSVTPINSVILVRILISGTPQYAGLQVQGIPSFVNIMVDTGPPGPCWPNLVVYPHDTVAGIGHAATFSASAGIGASCMPIAYQWRKGCTDLVDDGRISGANSTTLTIDPVLASDAGLYDVRIWGNLWMGPVWLRLGCYANCDESTNQPVLNANDFQCFLNQFASGNSSANCDGSSSPPALNANDFQCFLNAFASGCS